jgi:hypothetical protein
MKHYNTINASIFVMMLKKLALVGFILRLYFLVILIAEKTLLLSLAEEELKVIYTFS